MESKNKIFIFTILTRNILFQILTISVILSLQVKISAQGKTDSTLSKLISLDIEDLLNMKVSIATRSNQPESESPSVISVITSDDIKNMGARELVDVLQTIPGFELNMNFGGYYGIGVRGVKDSRTSSKILMMIDGVPFNQIFYGSEFQWGYDINLDNIEKIEIIRGPGSALYGRNAFSAVINIITKHAKLGKKVLAKVDVGTFNTYRLSGIYSYMKNKFDASIAISKKMTDVNDVKFDDGFGRLEPMNNKRNNLNFSTNVRYGKFRLLASYFDLTANAPSNETIVTNKIGTYSFSYDDSLNSKLNLHTRIFGHNSTYIEDIEQLRPNFQEIIPTEMGGNGTLTFADVYPNGICYKPYTNEYLYGFEADIKIRLHPKNNLLIGFQADDHGVKDIFIKSNYDFATGQAIPGITRSNMVKYEPGWFDNEKHNYQNTAFILQDIWHPVERIGITLGGRYDIDSDIGGFLSPRAGLVVEPFRNTSLKFLYGRAYRAPSPSEQYQTLGFVVGNKDLKPEIINTFEVAFSFKYNKMRNTINIYRNKLTDMIYAERISFIDPNNKYYNIGKNTSTGIEFESKFIIGQSVYSYINYSYSISENTQTINNVDSSYNQPDVAPHKLNLGINYSFLKYFNYNLNMYYRSEMGKFIVVNSGMDVKDPIGGYAILNSTLMIQNLIKNLTFSISGYNLTDVKYYSQDNQHFNQPPQPSRQFIFSIEYSIK